MLRKLVAAGRLLDRAFWEQSDPGGWATRQELARSEDRGASERLRMLQLNAGRYDASQDFAPLFADLEPRPEGGGFYEPGMTRQRLAAAGGAIAASPGHVVRERDGELVAVPYHEEWAQWVAPAARLVGEAADASRSAPLHASLSGLAAALATDALACLEPVTERGGLVVAMAPTSRRWDDLLGIRTAYTATIGVVDPELTAITRAMSEHLAVWQERHLRHGAARPAAAVVVYDDVYRGGAAATTADVMTLTAPDHLAFSRNVNRARFELQDRLAAVGLLGDASVVTASDDLLGHVARALAHRLGPEGPDPLEEVKAEAVSALMGGWMVEAGVIQAETARRMANAWVLAQFTTLADVRIGRAPEHRGPASAAALNACLTLGAVSYDESVERWIVDPARVTVAMSRLAHEATDLQVSGDEDRRRALLDHGELPSAVESAIEALIPSRRTRIVPVFTSEGM